MFEIQGPPCCRLVKWLTFFVWIVSPCCTRLILKKFVVNIIALFALTISPHVLGDQIKGRVVGVSDGDTITVLEPGNRQHKIRLSGIDAPEKAQPFGNVSKKSLSDMVFDRTVTVEYSKLDRYGRKVGKVIESGVDVNLRQVEKGMAWFYKKYQNEQPIEDRLFYLEAETKARQERLGLWLDNNPKAPWDFRRKR